MSNGVGNPGPGSFLVSRDYVYNYSTVKVAKHFVSKIVHHLFFLLLPSACYFNSDMLMHYHPGAMLKNRWSCCHQRGKTSLGCQPTYHLLTRSSSRYAQMRRKDTLTGSSSSGRRRSKVTSTYETRRSASSATQNEIEVSVEPQRQSLPVSVGVGISNSCVELRESPPHRPEAFTPEMPSSQRSSQLSTEPSVSMSSITFTRVSVLEAPPSEHGSEANRSSVAGAVGSIDRRLRSVRGSERDRRSGSNRSQVAPESAAAPKELDHYQVGPLEPEEKTVMRPRGKSLGNEGVVNHFRDDSSPPPPVPPRRRSAAHAASPAQFVPSVVPITETSPEPGMKHSQTFTVSFSLPVQYHPQSQLSSSLLALTKPTIAPRVSNTDPNIIHV